MTHRDADERVMEVLAAEEFTGLTSLAAGSGLSISTAQRTLLRLVERGLATYSKPGSEQGTPGEADVTAEGVEWLRSRGVEAERMSQQRARRRRMERLVGEAEQRLAEVRELLRESAQGPE